MTVLQSNVLSGLDVDVLLGTSVGVLVGSSAGVLLSTGVSVGSGVGLGLQAPNSAANTKTITAKTAKTASLDLPILMVPLLCLIM